MVKNVAYYRKLMNSLKVERENIYQKELKRYDLEIDNCFKEIQRSCSHPFDVLLVDISEEEDEYGKRMESWDNITVTCTICNKVGMYNKVLFQKQHKSYQSILE